MADGHGWTVPGPCMESGKTYTEFSAHFWGGLIEQEIRTLILLTPLLIRSNSTGVTGVECRISLRLFSIFQCDIWLLKTLLLQYKNRAKAEPYKSDPYLNPSVSRS